MMKNESHNETNSSPLPWIAGAILILGLAVLGGLYWSSTMKVKQVRFEGNHFVSTEDLRKIEVPTGINPDSINFKTIMQRFDGITYVEKTNISVQPNGDLLISIIERKPIAMLADGEKKIYVDRHGVRLPLKLGKTVDVPILYGFSATPMSDTLQSKEFKITSDFLMTVQQRAVSDATISEVAWTTNEGIVALTNQNGVKLVFGKGDFDNRLRNWEAFYGEVIKQKGIEAMRSIDLRFKDQIVTREKGD